jgi:hypothetical protein
VPASGVVVLGAATVYWGHVRRTTQDVTAGASLQQALRQVPRYNRCYGRCLATTGVTAGASLQQALRQVPRTTGVTAGASLQQALRQVPRYTHNRYDRCLNSSLVRPQVPRVALGTPGGARLALFSNVGLLFGDCTSLYSLLYSQGAVVGGGGGRHCRRPARVSLETLTG